MYLLMQYSDYGTIMIWDEQSKQFSRNQKLYERALEESELKYLQDDLSDLEKVAKFIFSQIAQGLKYLHNEAKVGHRDLKPENILYFSKAEPHEDDRVKIGDYTVATEFEGDDKLVHGESGTLPFLAPEVFTESSFMIKPLDVWAFGVTLYCYLTESLPFKGETDLELKTAIIDGNYEIL